MVGNMTFGYHPPLFRERTSILGNEPFVYFSNLVADGKGESVKEDVKLYFNVHDGAIWD